MSESDGEMNVSTSTGKEITPKPRTDCFDVPELLGSWHKLSQPILKSCEANLPEGYDISSGPRPLSAADSLATAIETFRTAVRFNQPSTSEITSGAAIAQRSEREVLKAKTPEMHLEEAAIKAIQDRRPDNAEKYSYMLLDYRKAKFGPDSKEVGFTCLLLGRSLALNDKNNQARKFFKEGAHISSLAFTEADNAMTALHTSEMARMDNRLGHYEAAAKEFKEALRIYEKQDFQVLRTLNSRALSGIADAYLQYGSVLIQLGQYQEAARQLPKAQKWLDVINKPKKPKKDGIDVL